MRIRSFAASTALLISTTVGANAQDGGFYAKVFGGASALQDNDFSLTGTRTPVSFDTGFIAGGAIGFAFADLPLRTELEYSYRTGDAGGLPTGVATGGDLASTSLMLNAIYAFDTATQLSPYVGLGLGYATEIDFDLDTPGGSQEFSDTGRFAYQLMLGAEYPLSDRWTAFGEARYFSAGSVTLSGGPGTTLRTIYDTFDVVLGVGLSF